MLRLRPLRPEDEAAFRAGHEQMAAEGFPFGLLLEPGRTWEEYLRILADHRSGVNLPDGWVPSTFLVADVDGQVVGDRVLVTCDDDNVGSIRAIESCGGKLDSVRPAKPGSAAIRRYWID